MIRYMLSQLNIRRMLRVADDIRFTDLGDGVCFLWGGVESN